MDMRLEVVVVPVSDVDRAKDFCQAPGRRLDADFVTAPDFRVIQMTPPGSACDGNNWFVQEVTTRLPGGAASAHGKPDPDWPDWYAQYMADESAGHMRGKGRRVGHERL